MSHVITTFLVLIPKLWHSGFIMTVICRLYLG